MESVYIDLYFLINVSMDFLCIMIASVLLHRNPNRWRALLAALFGGVYAVTALLFIPDGLLGTLADILTVIFMSAIVFWHKRGSFFAILRTAAVIWVTSMLLGGIMTALYAGLNRLNLPLDALQGDGLSVWTFVLVSAVAGILSVKSGRWFGLSGKAKRATVQVTLFGKSVVLHAMVDTGNLLCDPVSGKSVIVAELSALRGILPADLAHACESGNLSNYLSRGKHASRVRPIPANTATESGLLLAIVPDHITVIIGKERFSSNHLIAPRPLHLKDFDAIIGQ